MLKRSEGDDLPIVTGCIQKDCEAWSLFLNKYSGLISSAIYNRLKKYGFRLTHQDMEDIRQNILTSIWKDDKLADVKNKNNIAYWLAIVSGNMAMEYLRHKNVKEPVKTVSIFNHIEGKKASDLLPSTGIRPDDELSRRELSNKVKDAVESLPDKERLILKLLIFHDKKYHEIAGILQIPPGTVSTYIKRAKERLKKKLQQFRRF